MLQPGASTSSSPSSSFAGLLAALASPASKRLPDLSSDDSEDGLEDDIAILSYERALKAHSRHRSLAYDGLAKLELAEETHAAPPAPAPPAERKTAERAEAAAPLADAIGAGLSAAGPAGLEQDLKSASITIRMSAAECAQLRRRAAAAGLTVSAYLRSCAFEVETLRALVKDTMAQLRASATGGGKKTGTARQGEIRWLERLLMPWRSRQRRLQA